MHTMVVNKFWFTPLMGALMRNRLESLVISGAAAAQVALAYAHLPGWQCPIKALTGIPCPGCGLSTACSLLLQGQWQESIKMHAFAPFFILGIGVLAVVCVLPENSRQILAQKVSTVEAHTGLMAWFMAGLFLYWGLRLFQII